MHPCLRNAVLEMTDEISATVHNEGDEALQVRNFMKALHSGASQGKPSADGKPKKKTTSTERGKARRDRLRLAGLTDKPVWLKPAYWPLLEKIVQALNADEPLPLADISAARAVITEEDVESLSVSLSDRAVGILRMTADVLAGAPEDVLTRLERQLKIAQDIKAKT